MTSLEIATATNSPVPHPTRSSLRRSATLFALLALSWSAPAQAYPLAFPARGDSLGSGVYFESNGHISDYGNNGNWNLDISALAFYDNNWQYYKNGKTRANATNAEHYAFGANLYAPEDGEIIGCWDFLADKPSPAQGYDLDGDGIFGEDPDDASPMVGGNHIQLRTADGDYVIFLGHLQFDSIAPGLCPLPASRDADGDGWPDSLSKPCTGCSPGWESMRVGTILPTPVAVKKGDLLARLGHSGASGAPHLHLHVRPLDADNVGRVIMGPAEEIEFTEAWTQTCPAGQNVTTDDWDPLTGENPIAPYTWVPNPALPGGGSWASTPRYCFLPDAIGPQEDHNDYNLAATNLHFATHSSGDLLAYQSGGNLRLRSYKLESSGTITDQDTLNEGAVKDLAVVRPRSSRNVVVSIRGNDDNLKHIPYTVSTVDGQIVRQVGKELTEDDVERVVSTPSPAHDGFVVAVEDEDGNLKVMDYHVDNTLTITPEPSVGSGGAIDDVAITTVTGSFDGVVTAEVTTTGLLVLRSFEVPAAGGVTAADSYSAWVAADSVTIDTVPVLLGLGQYIVTSVRQTSDETLRLDTWEVDGSGQISWVATASAGVVVSHDATPSVGGGDLISALRDDDDDFRLIGWSIDSAGQIRRTATRLLGKVASTAIVASLDGGQDHLVAARTDQQDELHLFSYGSAFSPIY